MISSTINIMIINSTKPFIKGIDADALDIIDSLLAQSSLLLRFAQCLMVLMMMMTMMMLMTMMMMMVMMTTTMMMMMMIVKLPL